jgi:hypothetical protein
VYLYLLVAACKNGDEGWLEDAHKLDRKCVPPTTPGIGMSRLRGASHRTEGQQDGRLDEFHH